MLNIITLLLSLAVSDVGVGVLFQPTYVAVLVMKIDSTKRWKWCFLHNIWRILRPELFIWFCFLFWRFSVNRWQILGNPSSSQRTGTCDSQADCCCSEFSLGLNCLYQCLAWFEMDTDSWLYLNPIAIRGRIVEHWELLRTGQLFPQRIISSVSLTWKRKQLQSYWSYSKAGSVQRQKLNDGSWRFSRSCRRTWIKLSCLFSPVAIEQRKNAEWRKLKVFKVCTRLLSLTAPSTLFCLSLPSYWMS